MSGNNGFIDGVLDSESIVCIAASAQKSAPSAEAAWDESAPDCGSREISHRLPSLRSEGSEVDPAGEDMQAQTMSRCSKCSRWQDRMEVTVLSHKLECRTDRDTIHVLASNSHVKFFIY